MIYILTQDGRTIYPIKEEISIKRSIKGWHFVLGKDIDLGNYSSFEEKEEVLEELLEQFAKGIGLYRMPKSQ